MTKKLRQHTLCDYVRVLGAREPVPGGGSAAAVNAATGAALLGMVARYSLGKGASKSVEKKIERIVTESDRVSARLLELVDDDAVAYMQVVAARKGTPLQRRKAASAARAVPREIARLCYAAVGWAPYLVEHGNPYLLSDVTAATEFLLGAFRAAQTFQAQE